MKITALAALSPGAPLAPHTYRRTLGPEEVAIQVKYRSLYAGDAFFVDNFWGDSRYPVIPGTEFFGIVFAVGGKVTTVKVGDYVGVGYQVYACQKCGWCKSGLPQYCQKQKTICIHEPGALADVAIVDNNFVFLLPPKLQKTEFVSLMCAGLTVYSAIKKANLVPGSRVGVVGIGNLGHLAIQILAKQGCAVTAFSHTPEKEAKIRKLGATSIVNSLDSRALSLRIRTLDYILVTTYADLNWTKYLEILKPNGKITFVGLPQKKITFPAIALADFSGRTISGGYLGSPTEMRELLDFAIKHNVHAWVEKYPLQEANLVLDKIRHNKLVFSAVLE